jgi:Domain of unknown function (DUF4266)
MNPFKLFLISTPALIALGGCSVIQPVAPWEKSTLAQETMKPAGPVPALGRIDAHVYYSKEAVRGGSGVGGGGCGCN